MPAFLKPTETYIPRAVHRLDYETSGLIIISKTDICTSLLSKAFQNKEIDKKYLAVSIGKMPEENLQINTPIEGKESSTSIRILASLESEKYEFLNLLSVQIKSGRRNQIRKHLFEVGNPILGDKKFFIEGKLSYGNGLYLHSYFLEFIHPINGETIEIESEAPKKFKRLFNDYYS